MRRREFIKSAAIGVIGIGACGLIASSPSGDSAIQYLTKAYNTACKGKGVIKTPKTIVVSEDLYNTFSSELQPLQRFTSNAEEDGHKTLVFKSLRMIKSHYLQDWQYIFV